MRRRRARRGQDGGSTSVILCGSHCSIGCCGGAEVLCRETSGEWTEGCGHFICGEPPPENCEMRVPVCNCGADSEFVEGRGCQPTNLCNGTQTICEESGGRWDEGSCGHYQCGEFPSCDAIVPGCDCGEGRNFGADGCFGTPVIGIRAHPPAGAARARITPSSWRNSNPVQKQNDLQTPQAPA